MRSLLCVLACAAATIGLAEAGTAWAASPSHTIVVGYRIGPIKLAMTRGKVHHVYPHPHTTHYNNQADTTIEHYKHGQLTVTYCCEKKNPHVFSIATISYGWITAQGIAVGDSLEHLQQTYPVQCSSSGDPPVLDTCQLGEDNRHMTSFHMDPIDNVIAGIQVFGTAGL